MKSVLNAVARSLTRPARPAIYLKNFNDYMRTSAYEQDLAMFVGVEDSNGQLKFPNPLNFKVLTYSLARSLTYSLTYLLT